MTETVRSRITELQLHEEEPVFPGFDHHDAWNLGSLIVNHAIAAGHALLGEEFASKDFDPTQGGWLAPADYTLAGGSFPIRVRGAGVVAAVTVSGLSSDDDHQLAVDSIREYLRTAAR